MSEDFMWVEFEDKILLDKINELQQRIDKAIEYIKTDAFWLSQLEAEQKLLEILGDKENE